MKQLRVTASEMFALEIVRAALQDPVIPHYYQLRGSWVHMSMEMGDGDFRAVAMRLKIHGSPSDVRALCTITRIDGEWVRGYCTIEIDELEGVPGWSWTFECQFVDDKIVATQT